MRDIKRIKRILDKIKKCWMTMPDCRFYQMMINEGLMEDNYGYYNIEDDEVELHLDKIIKGGKKTNAKRTTKKSYHTS